MEFNICLYDYGNTATISVFSEKVKVGEERKRPKQVKKGKKSSNNTIKAVCPFTGQEVEIEKPINPVDDYEKKQDSLDSSVRRSKRNVLKLIRSMNLENAYFVTLTFDKSKVDRTDFAMCCKKTRVWLQNLRKQPGAEKMSFLCVPELHNDMVSWHSHCIICDAGNIKLTDSGHKDKSGRTIYNLNNWRYGFSTAVKISSDPESSIKLAKYVTKYFTKESEMIAQNKHRYFASQNIPKPRVRRWLYNDETEKIQTLEKIYKEGYKKIASNTFRGYLDIEYIDAIKSERIDD